MCLDVSNLLTERQQRKSQGNLFDYIFKKPKDVQEPQSETLFFI